VGTILLAPTHQHANGSGVAVVAGVGSNPGSLVPQRSSNPNGVIQFKREDPDLFAVLDSLQLFDTFSSVWFSSIYLLLFISLIGCILPRTNHHLKALRQPPPATPRNLQRLENFLLRNSLR